ncbi:MAG: ubiquinone-dependent pyruvate dehydrogenase, partial [Thermoplasmata archaeon]
ARPRVADVLVDTLVGAGVRRIYGVAGDSLNGITDSIRPRKEFRWVHVRHEEAAAFAAGAEAQLTGRIAVCAGSCGPGNLHLINGLYDAHRSRAPVLAIASQIPSEEIGRGYFQETNPELIFRECSHYTERIARPESLAGVLSIALRTAVARRGVAVVVLPGDVALEAAVGPASPMNLDPPAEAFAPPEEALARAAELLNGAAKVTILAGIGAAGARTELLALAGRIRAPIVHTLRGKESVEWENPFDVGMTGLLGFSSGYHAMFASELLLLLGTDFPYRQFYPPDATILQVDLRGEQIGRRSHVDLALVGDVGTTLRALLPRLTPKTADGHLTGALEAYRSAREGLDDRAVEPRERSPIHPEYVARVVSELASEDAIFSCDVGTPTVWAARYLRMNGKRRLLGSFVHGSMANALPQALGAQLSHPGRQVIALSGDGGLAMLLGELLTLRQESLPVKIVLFRNDALGFVTLEMEGAGFLDFATDLKNPEFAEIARASGILGLKATEPAQLRPFLRQALDHDGPALLEVVVDRQELIVPPSLDRAKIGGFGLFLLKAVLNGRGNEVVDLAKTNWFR